MAVTIRLARHGRRLAPLYRIVAADKAMKRDGRYLELLGTLNPSTNPSTVTLKEDRVKYWISTGAYPSDTMVSVINQRIPGFLDDLYAKRLARVQAKRKARKQRALGAPKKAAVAKAPKKVAAKAPKKAAAKSTAKKK